MKILFIDNFSFNFGVASISSILKQNGHDVELLYYPFSKLRGIDIYRNPGKYFRFDKISDEILAKNPDIIGFSVYSANFMFYKNTAESIRKKSNIPLLVGGVFPTINPDFFINNSCCDIVFRGESELVIGELIEKIPKGKYYNVPNIVYRGKDGKAIYNAMSSFVEDLDKLPFYDKDICPSGPFGLNMTTSRGCVFSCAYCLSGEYTRLIDSRGMRRVRKRSVDGVINEIKNALQKRPYKRISFWDDFFITSSKWLGEFAEKYSLEIGIPYSCIAFPASINKTVASLLSKSGCTLVAMGFQTANNEFKKNVLKRKETKELVEKAIKNLNDYGVEYGLDVMFNFPGETKAHIEESLKFLVKNKTRWVSIYFVNYYPDSYITKYAYENGFITKEHFNKISKNELIGEQAYSGTITDPGKTKEQIQYAVMFRLINLFPGKLILWMLKKNLQKLFPTNKFFYYGISLLTLFKEQGLNRVLVLISPYLQFKKSIRH